MKKVVCLAWIFLGFSASAQRIWYAKPAAQWEETLPLGNGRLGMMPDGGVKKESVVLNDITLWSGSPQDANNPDAHKSLPKIRELILAGRNDEAQALVNKQFVARGAGSGHGNGANVPFGCYQVLGTLHLDYQYPVASEPVDYQRELSLSDAMASTRFSLGGVTYRREYLTSFGDDVSVIRLTASKPGQLRFSVSVDRPERFKTALEGQELQLSGQLNNGTDGNGMRYLARIRVVLKEGTQSAKDGKLTIDGATEALLVISAGTDFRGNDFVQNTRKELEKALKKPFAVQKKEHTAKYRALYARADFSLGTTPAAEKPTDERLEAFRANPSADPALVPLYFQFGRYLSIASTRVGLLPPNLQGLWANQIQTPWNGDYHLDVNIQMNQWPVEVVNLPELNLPLADLVKGMVPFGEKTAKAYYRAEGWVAHVITNVWGYTEPGEDASWGATNAGSGWICNNLWQHYEFTNDTQYLRDIYPVLKGSAAFYNSVLIREPKHGWLVTAPSVSPENSFYLPNGKTAAICMGPTIDNQIVRELFSHVIHASEVLGVDEAFRQTLIEKRKLLPPPGEVASDGRLKEWLEEYREVEPKHRHISHLYGLYPASLITPEGTPELAEAARKVLEFKGDDSPGWSKAYKLLFWARLRDGNRAYKLVRELFSLTRETFMNNGAGGGVYPNMLSAGPPFQIDGNFGGTAGIAEMLVQSHAGYIELLPAIPGEWKSGGAVKGLKARGNVTVDFTWKDGKITRARFFSPVAQTVKVKYDGQIRDVKTEKLPAGIKL
ncbi:glycosyl hydrolase family 95 catalytic domain-containing protein [Siphonobacter aquaeclarae]|uniref:Alpha-L-fucosidase 2 n=1 Tax=Siphonobacter aquaeclarae TaxID=563176 RepID=A0A1G9YB86_9BACT|nr:glycoside hydrolase N-terminal domain-containing protein [Siphonobacter aquaeclarae]SDN06342.1 alpha-L-fucosidase 2 [Siphonobacter aquaeclarae]